MTNSYPFVVFGDEFKGKRVLVTGGTKGLEYLFNPGFKRFKPVSAKIIVRRLDGRMPLVPEGQHDSSQARSAWTAVWTFRDGQAG